MVSFWLFLGGMGDSRNGFRIVCVYFVFDFEPLFLPHQNIRHSAHARPIYTFLRSISTTQPIAGRKGKPELNKPFLLTLYQVYVTQ